MQIVKFARFETEQFLSFLACDRFVRFLFYINIYKHNIMINLTEADVRKIETLAKDIFLSIVKTQNFEDLEGNLNNVARFAVNTATTFLTNDWNQITKKVLNIK